MTSIEFSEQLDILLASHLGAISIDEYEKSVFLTLAQESVIKDFYNGTKPYELSEESRRALSKLTKTASIPLNKKIDSECPLTGDTYTAELPIDLFFIVYEQATLNSEEVCLKDKKIPVVPTSADVFYRTYANPFRGPSKSRALRLDVEDKKVEIISKMELKDYVVRYVRRPLPIILIDLSAADLSINGFGEPTECELEESVHSQILLKAVELISMVRGNESRPQPQERVQ